jgi:hypothetical protein
MPLHATTDLMFHAALNAGCSQGLAGLYMLLGPGLGVVPLDEETTEKFAGILKVWQQVADDSGLPLTLTQSNLFAFIGACKVSAPLGLWGAARLKGRAPCEHLSAAPAGWRGLHPPHDRSRLCACHRHAHDRHSQADYVADGAVGDRRQEEV